MASSSTPETSSPTPNTTSGSENDPAPQSKTTQSLIAKLWPGEDHGLTLEVDELTQRSLLSHQDTQKGPISLESRQALREKHFAIAKSQLAAFSREIKKVECPSLKKPQPRSPVTMGPQPEKKIPIAFGPCRYFKKTHADPGPEPKSSLGKSSHMNSLVSSWCCGVQKSDLDAEEDRVWRKCFLTLFSDSTLVVQEGQGEDTSVLASVRLDDVYREVKFGEMVACVPGFEAVPTTENKSLKTVLTVPDETLCNSSVNWLDFLTLNTLNKWLLAFCRAIPAEKLNENANTRAAKKEIRALQQKHATVEDFVATHHIQLFFPSAIQC